MFLIGLSLMHDSCLPGLLLLFLNCNPPLMTSCLMTFWSYNKSPPSYLWPISEVMVGTHLCNHIIAFWVFGNQLTFMAIDIIPQSRDCNLQYFLPISGVYFQFLTKKHLLGNIDLANNCGVHFNDHHLVMWCFNLQSQFCREHRGKSHCIYI